MHEWFATTLRGYKRANPLPPHILRTLRAACASQYSFKSKVFEVALRAYKDAQDEPEWPVYTCPDCRQAVANRPVEVFALKTVQEQYTVSDATGQSAESVASDLNWRVFFMSLASMYLMTEK